MKHALIIGGTGMLQNVSLYLNNESWLVSVIGRQTTKLEMLTQKSSQPQYIHPISVDYHADNVFRQTLSHTFNKYDFPELIVSWIHSSAPNALNTVIDVMKDSPHVWRLFHIQSSARFFTKENTPGPDNCLYRRVYLGFVLEQHASRWLTHDEISQGVINAIISDQEETTVGTLKPWDKRP